MDTPPPQSEAKPFAPVPAPIQRPDGIKHIIAVISGKGGVGKSTVSANIAASFAILGNTVGLFDADLTGHSQSMLFDTHTSIESMLKKHEPADCCGVKVASFGFLYPDAKTVIWRGPMISNGIKALFGQTNWGELDYLIVDLPPGTSDAQLTVIRDIPIDGCIVVTTPDPLAASVAERGLVMLSELNKKILGVVENMSAGVCQACGDALRPFGSGAGKKLAAKYGVAFFGTVPLSLELHDAVESRKPVVLKYPDSPASKSFFQITDALKKSLP